MKLTIFSRLVIGYLVIFVLVIVMNLYTIVRLGQLNDGTRSVLMTHHRMMENLGKLTDTLLSQIGNEKKFLITKDEAFYTQFSRLKRDWDRSFGEVMFLAAGAEVRGSLGEIKASYERYQSLLQEEAPYVRRGLSYTAQQFKEAKWPIGSGVVEAACKTVVSERLKQSGMRWSMRGGQAILTLRSLIQSDRWEGAWRILAGSYQKEVLAVRPSLRKVG